MLTHLDLDSICSAVFLAYLRTYSPFSRHDTFYIPLSNLPRRDLTLRPELAPVLSHANLKPSDLITLSDLTNYPKHIPAPLTRWVLVDHNSLQGELGSIYASRVVGCIDHHEDERQVPWDCGSEPRIVEEAGSCSSLVLEYCKPSWIELGKTQIDEAKQWNAELARLAIAPVLADTANLMYESKTTTWDKKAVRYLEAWILAGEGGEEYSNNAYFNEIAEAKENIGGLSLRDIWRKDYKQWEERNANLGVSAVAQDMAFLIEKAGSKEKLLETVKKWGNERGLSLVAIMTTSHPGGVFKRELLLWGLDSKGAEAAKRFSADAEKKLQLEKWGDGELDIEGKSEWRRCWRQNKVESSRKQVAPLLRTSLNSS
jgi:exopolyphosphatase